MTQRLTVKNITSIGAVFAGDNPDAEIMFYKTKPEPVQGQLTKKEGSMPFDIDTLTDEGKAYVSELETKLAALSDEPAVLPDDLDPVTKARLDDQDAAIAKAQIEKDKVEKDLADLRDEMATEKYTARAEQLAALLGDADEVAPVLKALAAADAEAFSKLDGMFDSLIAAEPFETLLKEFGEAGSDATAIDQITAHTAEIKKANPELTLAAARAQAWTDHPDLLRQSREEN